MSDKLKMHSPNLVDANIEKIAALFPNCVTEAQGENGELKKAVDFDLLKQELSQVLVEGEQERYRLDWVGKKESILTANAPIAKTLRPCREESVNFDTTENLFIEGDNLEALKLLQENYLGKVKMIYIDPPYNTGKDFIYEDDFAESTDAFFEKSNQVDEEGNRLISNTESNGRFHSDWLSMMYSRLKLSRNLLQDDGIIFINIDDNEVSNLEKISNEIFGEENLIATFTIKVRYEGKTLVEDMTFQKVVETILVYSKSKKNLQLVQPTEDYSYEKFIWEIVETGQSQVIELGGKKIEIFDQNSYEVVKKPYDKSLLKEIWATGSILDGNSSGRFFRDYLTGRYKQDGLGVLYKVYGIGDDDRDYRYFTGPKRDGATKGKYFQGVPINKQDDSLQQLKKKPIVTYLDLAADFGNCRHEGNIDFRSGKKPTILIRKLASIIKWNKDDICLDFFAGSATTAHSILQLNVEDGINRKFIMVQIPEKIDENSDAYKTGFINIADLSKERIRRSGKKILDENKDKEGIENLDIGFRVLKIDSTNMKDVYYTPDALKQADMLDLASNIKDDRTSEDLLFQVMLDWGLELSLPIERKNIAGKEVFYVAGNSLVACFDDLTFDVVDEVAKDRPLRFVSAEKAIHLDHDKTNIKERFKQLSPDTEVKFL